MMPGAYSRSQGIRVSGTASTILAPTGAVSGTAFTVNFPAGISGRPVRLRVAGTVFAQITVQVKAGQPLSVNVNPNTQESFILIPKDAFPAAVNQISGTYSSAAAGSIGVLVDFQ